MTRAPRRAWLLAAVAVLAALGLAFGLGDRASAPPQRPPGQRPMLLLLTSLPLAFGEDFSLDGAGSPALDALRTRYDVRPISVTDAAQLRPARLLLMAHPLAQPPEALVDLDEWVRAGGRVLLLADPLLEWPSARPLGDPLRSPPMFQDTGLLAHWGLALEAPAERGPKAQQIAGFEVLTASPGRLSGRCEIGAGGLVAHCTVGKGRATVIADADILDVAHLDGPSGHNLDAILSELESLER